MPRGRDACSVSLKYKFQSELVRSIKCTQTLVAARRDCFYLEKIDLKINVFDSLLWIFMSIVTKREEYIFY